MMATGEDDCDGKLDGGGDSNGIMTVTGKGGSDSDGNSNDDGNGNENGDG